MKLRKKTAAAMIMALLCATLASGCGQTKIGYIDGERVSKEAPQINSLIEEGNQKIEEAQTQASRWLGVLRRIHSAWLAPVWGISSTRLSPTGRAAGQH